MERSLTVLLPVHNAQSTLADTVAEILEVVSDLTRRFELVIVDDGSVDATSEVAEELTSRFPQVRALRHGQPMGREAAICSGLEQSSGEMILLRDETPEMATEGIAKLWHAAEQREIFLAGPETPGGPKRGRLGRRHAADRAGFQMVDRPTMEKIHRRSQPKRPNYLSRLKGFALGE